MRTASTIRYLLLCGGLFLQPSCFILTDIRGVFADEKNMPVLVFPRDHGNHLRALTEWWYFNGHLQTEEGKNYTYGFCLFRASRFLYVAHVSITDIAKQDFRYERIFYPRGSATFGNNTAAISYGNEQLLELTGNGSFRIRGRVKDITINLELTPARSPMLVNGKGVIDMPEGGLSSYYSLTQLRSTGTVSTAAGTEKVNGISWMDHQWGDYYVRDKGWDWFSVQLEDSTEYNLYSFRNGKGKPAKHYVNRLNKDAELTTSYQLDIRVQSSWKSPVTSQLYGTAWQLIIPRTGDTLEVRSVMDDQELYPSVNRDFLPLYWEGGCYVWKRTADGRKVRGVGFAEQFPLRQPVTR